MRLCDFKVALFITGEQEECLLVSTMTIYLYIADPQRSGGDPGLLTGNRNVSLTTCKHLSICGGDDLKGVYIRQ